MQQVLVTMLGLPGSGKSYFARQLGGAVGAVRLNGDSMRDAIFEDVAQHHDAASNKLTFGAIDYATHEILKAGHSVIYDANISHQRERQKNAAIARAHNTPAVVVWIQVPIEAAIERINSREETIDQPHITVRTIEKHQAELEEPSSDELVIHINGLLPFEEQLSDFNRQLEALLT